MKEFAARMFACRDIAHKEHWKTDSYAHHVALAEFYESMIDQTDRIVEMHQGEFGLIDDFNVMTRKVDNISDYLRETSDWLEEHKEVESNGNSAIINAMEELIGLFQRTLYKLDSLS